MNPPLPFLRSFRRPARGLGGLCLAALLGFGWARLHSQSPPPPGPAPAAASPSEVAALRAEIEHLKGLVPDQAHAMQDVGYHFANLWFAAGHQNWALADFYLGEARSHLRWAVRIRPIRQTKAGDLDLGGILDGLDKVQFRAVKEAIDAGDAAKFEAAYRSALEGCLSCHRAAEKPYLQPGIPRSPAEHILNLEPAGPR